MNRTVVGVNIAKKVFQVHYIDPATGEIVNKPIKRAKFLEFFANREPCSIGMEEDPAVQAVDKVRGVGLLL